MRVIAGTYRSRLLVSPPGSSTRPTSDRLRETMFNILAARRGTGLEGMRFADLYAGTGAVGIEALSRGAFHCWFSEKAAPALKSLRANLATLKVSASTFTVDEKGTGSLLATLVRKAVALDIVFIDPPYEGKDEYEATLGLLGNASGRKLLARGALVLAEHATKSDFSLAVQYGALQQTRVYKQGETSLTFYELASEAEGDGEAGGNADPV